MEKEKSSEFSFFEWVITKYKACMKKLYVGPEKMGELKKPPFLKYQSPTYALFNWMNFLAIQLITSTGRIIILIGCFILFYGLFDIIHLPLNYLSFAIITFMLINKAVSYIFKPRVKMKRHLPYRAAMNEDVTITYEVENNGKLPCFDLAVDTIPYNNVDSPEGYPTITCLEPDAKHRIKGKLRFKKRGRYHLPALYAETSFPFGLLKTGKFGDGDRDILIYPNFTPLEKFHVPDGLRYQPGGISISSQNGETLEFNGCREFREGDNPKHIHWPSWAKTGTPIIKEYIEEYLTRIGMILDTFIRPDILDYYLMNNRHFESAVSLSASIADNLSHKDYIIDFFAAGPDIYTFTSGKSTACLESILNILASIETNANEPFLELKPHILDELSQFSCIVIVLLTIDEDRLKMLRQITQAGVAVKPIVVSTETFEPEELAEFNIRQLHPKAIIKGEVTEL